MNAEFGSSRIVATLGLSTFVLGIAFGPMWSPLSEFFGRRPIYLVSFALFVIWLIPSAVAQNIETMLIARFFQGFAGSAFLSVAGGTVGDLFNPHEMQAAMSVFTMAPFAGPSMGPLIGGFVNYHVNWRWTHYILIIWGFLLFLGLFFFVPETYRKSPPRFLSCSLSLRSLGRDLCGSQLETPTDACENMTRPRAVTQQG